MFTHSAHLYDAIYAWKDYDAEAERVRELVARHGRPDARTLLDVACGTGRHLARLQQWFDVAGTELDPVMLAVAQRRLPGVPLYQADLRELALARRFDVVTCLFSSIGYVRTMEGLRRGVRALARHLAPGGVLILEPWFAPEAFRSGHHNAQLVDLPHLKVARVSAASVNGGVSVLDFHYLVASGGEVSHFVERHELGLFTDAQYRAALAAAGLTVAYEAEGLSGRGIYIGTRHSAFGTRQMDAPGAECRVPSADV